MKKEVSNLWKIIRWALAAVIYVLTLVLAMAMIKTRDASINAEMAASRKLREDLKTALGQRDKYKDEKTEWMDKWNALNDSSIKLIGAVMKEQVARNALNDSSIKLIGAVQKEQAARTILTATRTLVPNPYPTATQSAPVIPTWFPPTQSEVFKTIHGNARAAHKNDYAAVNYEVERQTEGFEKLLRYYKTDDQFIKDTLNTAALEYGTNYASFAYAVERQLEARLKFERSKPERDPAPYYRPAPPEVTIPDGPSAAGKANQSGLPVGMQRR